MIRDDMSNKLVHLTRGDTAEEAAERFLSIVKEKVLRGGTGEIRGGFNCVCFTEAPIGKLSQILAAPSVHGMRYAPLGVMVDKLRLFRVGGRPVIYQPDAEYDLLHEPQRYRHKQYEPDRGIDFSWEREWRIHTKEFHINPEEVTLVVPNRPWAEYFHEEHTGRMRTAVFALEEMGAFFVKKAPWHFIVLEDLGVHVDFSYLPTK